MLVRLQFAQLLGLTFVLALIYILVKPALTRVLVSVHLQYPLSCFFASSTFDENNVFILLSATPGKAREDREGLGRGST